MEALIYHESPIAEYLEGDAIPFEPADRPSTPPCVQTFAPRGLPKLRERLRTFRQTAASLTDVANEKFLERFRYTVVASQLLDDDPRPKRHLRDDQTFDPNTFSIRGAAITAAVSFAIAGTLHLLRQRFRAAQPLHLSDIALVALLLLGGCLPLIYFARRQYLDFVRRSAGAALGKIVSDSHTFDNVAAEGLRFVQEVEVVSRGYEVSHPLPPVSRLEDKVAVVRCRGLRGTVGFALTAGISHWVEAHNAIQPFVRDLDLRRYHEIYEVSMQDYTDAVTFANSISSEAQDSLRELRFLFRLHSIARKVFLCDLLALQSGSTWYNIRQWRGTLQRLRDLETVISQGSQDLRTAVVREEFGDRVPDRTTANCPLDGNPDTPTPQKRHTIAQMRRFDAVANAIRSLNAKIHLSREEMNLLSDDTAISTSITRHYENLGAEIRNTLVEWEKGRNTMFLNIGTDHEDRFSRAFSDLRSPVSPSPSSLGGVTVVDGGPVEALGLLTGEGRGSSDGGGLDEEVFEAVALPRKRMSWTPMSREEKLSRLQEDRRKRATVQEQADNTTNMLRELQMVIKHRPNSVRSTTRITSI